MSKKIFVTRRIPEVGLTLLREHGYDVDVGGWQSPPTKEELIAAFSGTQFDGAITLLTDAIDKDVMEAAPSVQIFSNYAVGYNNFDIEEGKRRGVVMTNTPGGYSFCIAEHTIALAMALSTRLVEADRFVRAGGFAGWDPMLFVGSDLKGKILGLIGAGRIGAEAARIAAKGFNMTVIYHDVNRNKELERECDARFVEDPDAVVKEADIVSLHVPLLDSTRHLIDERRLSLMKPTAFLVNTSRGAVVDENALVRALREKKIAGAGLDVFEFEPRLADGLSELDNVVLTPHIASSRESARNEMSMLAAQNVIDHFENGGAKNRVNL